MIPGRYRKGRYHSAEVLPLLDTLFDALSNNKKYVQDGVLGRKVDVLFSEYVYRRDRVRYGKATVKEYIFVNNVEKTLKYYGTKENLKKIDLITI